MSRKFLEEIYYGNILPTERNSDKHGAVYQLSLLSNAKCDEFRNLLTDELKDKFDRILALELEKACAMELDGFVFGCRFMYRLLSSCADDESRDFEHNDVI